MKVHFSVVEEFLEELTREQEHVHDHLVRATYLDQPSKVHQFLLRMELVAGAVVRGTLIELRQNCGEVWDYPEHETTKRTRANAAQLMEQLTQGVMQLGLEIRKGMFEP